MLNLICSRCGDEKLVEEFSFKNKSKGTYQSSCKLCDKIIRKESYNKNKTTTYVRNAKNSKKSREWYIDYKSTLKCSICDENHPACLDFHHEDRDIKESEIARLAGHTFSIEYIMVEINKCIVLCANCHRKHHFKESNNGKDR